MFDERPMGRRDNLPTQADARSRLSTRFERFADECVSLNSSIYERLSRCIAQDNGLLELSSHALREPVPNVLFGAVHYLLLDGADHKLREYYPSIVASPREDEHLFQAFADFCDARREEILALINSRLVQTNEVNRSTILVPAFGVVGELTQWGPLALVEVGASAGLNLCWDRYRIEYSDGTVLGDEQSTVCLRCENRGAPFGPAMDQSIPIATRTGIDLHPIDLTNAAERLWLRALVWPDHRERATRLEAAIALVLDQPPQLTCGNVFDVLPHVLATSLPEATLCVYHSAVLYQFSPDDRERFSNMLADLSKERPLWHISAENEQGLRLFGYQDGRQANAWILGEFDAHGRWIDWQPIMDGEQKAN